MTGYRCIGKIAGINTIVFLVGNNSLDLNISIVFILITFFQSCLNGEQLLLHGETGKMMTQKLETEKWDVKLIERICKATSWLNSLLLP